MDVVTLQRLMGHADLSVIDRYLALLDEDLQRAHKTTRGGGQHEMRMALGTCG
jgi:site-specific recombinase XerD